MANMNVQARLTRIEREIDALRQHMLVHSGVSLDQAFRIDNLATEIAISAAEIAEEARRAYGEREKPGSLILRVKKALGRYVTIQRLPLRRS
jgi:predicted HicB family RNase H-like nuclease